MTDDKLDRLQELLGEKKASGRKAPSVSRLTETGVSKKAARQATGAKKSEGTAVVSFRVPEHIEAWAIDTAARKRIPYAEFKKAVFYRGLVAFAIDGEEPPMEYDREVSAAVPDVR